VTDSPRDTTLPIDCIDRFLHERHFYSLLDLNDDDFWPDPQWTYYLAAAGQAIARIRLAASLAESAREWELADYHAYCGVSSALTAIDTFALWLNEWLMLGLPSKLVGLGKPEFRRAVSSRAPEAMYRHVERLVTLLRQIEPYRHLAQHRNGLIVVSHFRSVEHLLNWEREPADWRIAPPGRPDTSDTDPTVSALLLPWSTRIEAAVCGSLKEAGAPPEAT
jgi:hypothetical protein